MASINMDLCRLARQNVSSFPHLYPFSSIRAYRNHWPHLSKKIPLLLKKQADKFKHEERVFILSDEYPINGPLDFQEDFAFFALSSVCWQSHEEETIIYILLIN